MDKNAIKKYAVWARRELISRVSQKALQYGITDKDIIPATAITVNGVVLSADESKQRKALIERINAKGYEQVMEEVAYTWFNRFIALRFMEVNGYLPSHVRVFTDEDNAFKPQILAEAISLELDGLDIEKVYALKEANNDEELFKYLVIAQCNALNPILPGMFQRIADYTELLFPDNLLRDGSAIQQMIELIPEEDWDVRVDGQVEIIGWLYQYYISEKHDEVVGLHGSCINKENIPAATQLFTTDWVVRYIIDNSLGRYWIERNPSSTLKSKLEYFVAPKNGDVSYVNEIITPEELTVFDPCVGSGHFVVYAFDVLMKIYAEYGYTERDAVAAIVGKNLYGLDIDDRAAQLAYFAIMMKARQYDRRFFHRGIQPNCYAIQESNAIHSYDLEYFAHGDVQLLQDINSIVSDMTDAKEYGSIIQVHPVNFSAIFARFEEIDADISIEKYFVQQELLPIVKQAYLLTKKYAVVVTNPPYLNKYNPKLKKFLMDNCKDYSGDLFSVFMYRNFAFCLKGGYTGFMTPNVWMFIKTYEKLRRFIFEKKSIVTLVQMAKGAFFKEATVDVCAFVLGNSNIDAPGEYIRLEEFRGDMETQKIRTLEALRSQDCSYRFSANKSKFLKIGGNPVAFWVSDVVADSFTKDSLESISFAKAGIVTGDDNIFLRFWYEINFHNIRLDISYYEYTPNLRWVPMNKGGSYRKYYGNYEYVMDIFNLWTEGKTNQSVRRGDTSTYFREAITWSMVTSGKASFRYSNNKVFGVAAPAIFMDGMNWSILGYLNSKVVEYFNCFLNPTINILTGNILSLPSIERNIQAEERVKENVSISKDDWDSFETSWDFKVHPLVAFRMSGAYAWGDDSPKTRLESAYKAWEQICEGRFNKLKENEEELNRIFIDIYGLQDELTPEVEDKDVTVRLADKKRDIKSLISYAVGCMFGRYSLDVPGLAYAGGEWDDSKYVTFKADKDSIIPICDDEYFTDDIVGRFVRFIEVVYGKDTLQENLRFIAEALGGSGQPKDVIRNYFLNDFYADHLKIYQKRPIYWLFDSGKKGGFKALVYMHRYQPDTIARMRTDYVHEQQARYRTAIADLEQRIASASTSERVKLSKRLKTLQEQATEIQAYEEKIHHLADQYIAIDLDDGVKANYAKFQDVLAKIK